MKIMPIELERLNDQYFPEPFQKALLEGVFIARRDAFESGKREYDPPEAENVYGFNTRAKLEGLMRSIAERYRLKAEVVKQPGQPWNHVEVRSGPMVLTAASVTTPAAMVAPSDYRRGLAESNQLSLWAPENATQDKPLYVILTHCRSRWLPTDREGCPYLPGSARLVFPAADFEEYIHVIDLMEKYSETVKKYTPQDWDEAAIVRYLQRTSRSASGWA